MPKCDNLKMDLKDYHQKVQQRQAEHKKMIHRRKVRKISVHLFS